MQSSPLPRGRLSAKPGLNVQPTAAGIEVKVRYITRAYERHEARKRMYEAVVELMHGKREAVKLLPVAGTQLPARSS